MTTNFAKNWILQNGSAPYEATEKSLHTFYKPRIKKRFTKVNLIYVYIKLLTTEVELRIKSKGAAGDLQANKPLPPLLSFICKTIG